ncbi:MAG: hypothetical protein M1605_03030 [Candidatus Thermoplasmatota archaeon]|nr:hypothetical protein [Candidatus Thermoplasmatota archaeon]
MNPMKYIRRDFATKNIDFSNPYVKKFLRIKRILMILNIGLTAAFISLIYLWGA